MLLDRGSSPRGVGTERYAARTPVPPLDDKPGERVAHGDPRPQNMHVPKVALANRDPVADDRSRTATRRRDRERAQAQMRVGVDGRERRAEGGNRGS